MIAAPISVAEQNDRRETFEAFFIVMGLSFFPVVFGGIGLLCIYFKIIPVSDYNPNGTGVKALGHGMRIAIAFAMCGFLVPMSFSLYAIARRYRARATES